MYAKLSLTKLLRFTMYSSYECIKGRLTRKMPVGFKFQNHKRSSLLALKLKQLRLM